MTLKQLEAFYWAATLGSFSVASVRLNVTQSSLSKRISDLETDLGKKLFDRAGQRAVITDAGEKLMPSAARILKLEREIRSDLDAEGTLRGICRFGLTELSASTWFPKFVTRVRALYPNLILEPHVDLTRNIERLVERGDLDFAVIPGPTLIQKLACEEICELEYAWMASPSRLAAGTELTASHFLQHPVITLPPEAGLAHSIDRWASAQKLELPRALTCNSLLALIGLTMAGVGISYFPRRYIRPLVEQGHLVELTSTPPLPNLKYCFYWRRDDTRGLLRVLRQLVIEEVDFLPVMPFPYGRAAQ